MLPPSDVPSAVQEKLIIQNATAISKRCLPTFDAGRNFHFIKQPEQHQNDRDVILDDIMRQRAELNDHERSQFVSFRK